MKINGALPLPPATFLARPRKVAKRRLEKVGVKDMEKLKAVVRKLMNGGRRGGFFVFLFPVDTPHDGHIK